jgi:hypothetical protein
VLAPRAKLLPGWMVPIHPFSIEMWYAFGVSVIVCTATLHVTSQLSMRLLGQCDSSRPMSHMFILYLLRVLSQVFTIQSEYAKTQNAAFKKLFSTFMKMTTVDDRETIVD